MTRPTVDGNIENIDLSDAALTKDRVKQGERPAWLVHALSESLIHDFRQEHATLPFDELLARFNQVVAFRYKEDSLTAGIHTSYLGNDPDESPYYYVAVHRFPKGLSDRKVVCSIKSDKLSNAIQLLVTCWFKKIEQEEKDKNKKEAEKRRKQSLEEAFSKDEMKRLRDTFKIAKELSEINQQNKLEDLLRKSVDIIKTVKKVP